jgi:hypothetical protein
MKKSENKYYRQSYNNPGQYNFNHIVETMEKTEDEKLLKILSMQITGLRDAKNDKAKGTYNFIL